MTATAHFKALSQNVHGERFMSSFGQVLEFDPIRLVI